MNIKSILATKRRIVFTISPDATLQDAVKLLTEHNIGALVVTGLNAEVVGIISERDVVRRAAEDQQFFSRSVSEIMTREVIVGLPEDDIMSVAHTMTERRFRHIPIIDKDQLIGIISIGDLLKAQRDQYRGQMDTLETQILAKGE
jgi:CBS domain-containing protein